MYCLNYHIIIYHNLRTLSAFWVLQGHLKSWYPTLEAARKDLPNLEKPARQVHCNQVQVLSLVEFRVISSKINWLVAI